LQRGGTAAVRFANQPEVDMSEVKHVSFSRRQWLAGASAGVAAGVIGTAMPARAKAPMLNTQAPAFYRFKIGGIDATVVSDGALAIGEPSGVFRGPSAQELGRMMADHFLPPNNVVIEQNVLAINTGEKLAVFETGMSSVAATPGIGRLMQSLKAAGIEPADVDALIPTHAHIDHIGGIMAADGSRNFPNAQIHIAQADFDFWTDDKRLGTPGESSGLAARKNLLPNRDRIVFYKDGQDVLPGVQAMHTPGHTVGHTSFVINSGGQSLFLVGDITHHVLLIEKPQMEVTFDTDARQGIATRMRVLDMLAAQKMPALVYHLPWPGIGHFAKQGDGFQFLATPMQMVL
jgi:glyoxylase-like metal-dependent hydrolase (beta-lactamase superfamily II)